jgi:Lrp/AsnC family leucine-responsive transcriptional regulator
MTVGATCRSAHRCDPSRYCATDFSLLGDITEHSTGHSRTSPKIVLDLGLIAAIRSPNWRPRRMFDDIDCQILELLQDNARINNAEIARQVGMAPSAVLERLRKLEKKGILRGYETRLEPHAAGLGLLAFVMVKTNEKACDESAGLALARFPEVLEVHHVAGEDCYLLKVRTPNPEALGRLLREKFGGLGTVTSTRSTIVLESIKEETRLPLDYLVRRSDNDCP